MGKFIDETGNKYGKLTVLYKAETEKGKPIKWHCLCECGNEKIVLGKTLRAGLCNSCGCLKSRGEERTLRALIELGLDFKQEYCFDKLYLNEGWPLRFDFAIFEDGEVIALIECQGEQHYGKNKFFLDNSLQIRDNLKKKFCLENKIPLIEIPYYDYDKIDTEYLRRVMNL